MLPNYAEKLRRPEKLQDDKIVKHPFLSRMLFILLKSYSVEKSYYVFWKNVFCIASWYLKDDRFPCFTSTAEKAGRATGLHLFYKNRLVPQNIPICSMKTNFPSYDRLTRRVAQPSFTKTYNTRDFAGVAM